MQISSYILVAVTFNRLTIMFNRHTLFWKKRQINSSKQESVKSVVYMTATIVFLVSAFNFHFIYYYALQDKVKPKENQFINYCTVIDKSSSYFKFRTKIYGRLSFVLFIIIPCCLLFIMNLLIIAKVMPACKKPTAARIRNSKRNKQRRSLSIMLIAICLWFVFLKTPASIYITLDYKLEMYKDYYPFTYSLFMLINYTNHAINLIIYVLISSGFRNEMKNFLLSFYKYKKVENISKSAKF